MLSVYTNIDDESFALRYEPKNLIVFSHLRWDFVYQRPQHLLTRFAANFRIYVIEEPVYDLETPYYEAIQKADNITVIVPHIPHGLNREESFELQATLLDNFMQDKSISDFAFWYYTPMALEFSRQYKPRLIIFDCMDELSAFKFAAPELLTLEQELLGIADVVFTGGNSLYQAKKHQHNNIHPFPSSIEVHHFNKARKLRESPPDQIATQQPKLGFYGVIDERFDIDLIRDIAEARPDWHIILIGPIVKIDAATLPQKPNIHYLGSKTYQELPLYMATWNIALIPFLLNESTRFISPTKTPEYLAAGLPVISTPIQDVIKPYGVNKLVHIGSNATDFIAAAEEELHKPEVLKQAWLKQADAFLAKTSWDKTYQEMLSLAKQIITSKSQTLIAQ